MQGEISKTMNWKHLFRPHILERGRDYYYEGAIENFAADNNSVTATVCGNDDYEIEIHLHNNQISDMYCSCPYASEGKNCKHMAAVLYEWEAFSTDTLHQNNNDLAKTIDLADETLVRSFLYDILSKDSALANKFMLLCPNADFNLTNYKSIVEDIIYNHSDCDGYINYYSAPKLFDAIDDILYDNIDILLQNKQYNEAFELSVYVAQRVSQVDIDDSDGGITMMFERCYDIWKFVINHFDVKNQKQCFNTLAAYASDIASERYCMQSFFDDFLTNHFDSPGCTGIKIKYLDNQIDKFSEIDCCFNHYKLQTLLINRLKLISDSAEQENFCRKYWAYPDIRQQYVSFCIDREDYTLAIRTLLESITLDTDLPGLITSYKKQLKDLYKLTQNYDSYISVLKELVISLGGSDLDLYCELKSQYTENEWIKIRASLFKQITTHNIHILYNAEGMYSELLKCAIECEGLYLMSKYEDILAKLFPLQVLDKYTDVLNKYASYTGTRNRYRDLVNELRKMKKLPGGEERVAEISTNWKIQYKRRRAMMDELNRL